MALDLAHKTKAAAVLIKEETSYNVDAAPVHGTDAIEVISDLTITPQGDIFKRAPFDITLSPRKAILGARWLEVSFIVENKGSGAAGTAPRGIGPALQACFMTETISAGTSVTYTPASSSPASVTIWIYLDGRVHKLTGCVGSVKQVLRVGETEKLEFTFWGFYAAATDLALLPAITYDDTNPQPILSATFTFDSVAFDVEQLEFDLGGVVAVRKSINAATGVKGFTVTSREPKGSFNPETILAATYDFFTEWEGSVENAISVVNGSVAGNIITTTAPKATLDNPGYEDRDGVRAHSLPFNLARNSGDDELSIAYT